MLICLIVRREPVVLYDGVITRLFYHGRVYTAKDDAQFPQNPQTWCLIDHNSQLKADIPAFIVTNDREAYPVQASSPSPTNYKAWIKQFCATVLGMPLWSKDDIVKAYVSLLFINQFSRAHQIGPSMKREKLVNFPM